MTERHVPTACDWNKDQPDEETSDQDTVDI
jgi:hypothetical protein